jgi:hypothetical protein
MVEGRKKALISGGIILLAVFAAYIFRLIGRGCFYPTLFSYLRSFIYIGMFAAWGLSVRQRIVQKQVRRYLTGVSLLLILWFTLRSEKYFIFWQPNVIRYLWYLYYLPMLFIPTLALLIAMSLGKPDKYKLPKSVWLLFAVSGALLILVLTNDLHQLVFSFSKNADIWSDESYGYGVCYFAVIGWQVLCAAAALVVMLFKCRLKNRKLRFLPVIPLIVSLNYLVLNYIGIPWQKELFGDVTAFQSLMYMLCFEACIACGYIHSNSRYADLFASSVGTSAQITDMSFNVRYAAMDTKPISREKMMHAIQSPVTLADGLNLHTMPIGGGYAVWTEDVSALLEARENFEGLAEELAERNEILRYEYKREARRRRVEEQNRLYDLLRCTTQAQINRISTLTKEYQKINKTEPTRAKTLLAEIAVLCSYIKRRKHLTLLADRDCSVAIAELVGAFTESLQALTLLTVRTTFFADSRLSVLPGKSAAEIFDFYEQVIESDLENISSIQVSLAYVEGLRLSVNICCKADLSFLAFKGNIRYETDDDEGYQHLVFLLEGDAAV